MRHALGRISRRLVRAISFGRVIARAFPGLVLRQRAPHRAAAKLWHAVRARDLSGIEARLVAAAGVVHADPDAAEVARIRAHIAELPERPRISILLPTFDTREAWLRCAIDSVRAQLYPDWELCIADDASRDGRVRAVLDDYARRDSRIRLHFRAENGGIAAATNSALSLATGEFTALLDHDDELRPDALYHVACEINAHPDADLVYSDEDKISPRGRRCDPYFKPDWNYDLFLSHNLITHLAVYRTERLRAIGGFRRGFEGAQDYDLGLRFIEGLPENRIRHIPRLLYHWRQHEGSTAYSHAAKSDAPSAARRAIKEYLARRGIDADVLPAPEAPQCHRVKYALPASPPWVTLIVPTRNHVHLLRPCIDSVVNRTHYPSFDIMVVDNGSDDRATLDYLHTLERTGAATILRDDRPFNFSALMNNAVRHARGEIICLLNNDIEVIAADWLSEMVSHAIRPDIGAVGARLWYPDFTLQHGGVVLGIGGVAGHAHKRLPRGQPGHAHRAMLIQNFSAVTAACLVARKAVYRQVNGFDEALAVAFNDVDFCLRVRASGYRILWTPYAELLHRESATRGPEHTREKQLRFAGEVALMKSRWGELLLRDPAYNPNLTLDRQDFSIAWPPRTLPTTQDLRRGGRGPIDPGPSGRGLTASLAAPPVAQRGP